MKGFSPERSGFSEADGLERVPPSPQGLPSSERTGGSYGGGGGLGHGVTAGATAVPASTNDDNQGTDLAGWSSGVEVSSQTWLSPTGDQNLFRSKTAKNLSCLDFILCLVLYMEPGPLGITPA